MNVRPPQDGVCPMCGAAVESARVEDSKRGRCVVLWPCRDVYPLSANASSEAGS